MEQKDYLLEITWGSGILSLDLGEGESLHRAVGKEKVILWRCRDQERSFKEREVSQSFLLSKTSAGGIMIVRQGEA